MAACLPATLRAQQRPGAQPSTQNQNARPDGSGEELIELNLAQQQKYHDAQMAGYESRRTELDCIRRGLSALEKTLSDSAQTNAEFVKLAFLEIFQRLDRLDHADRED